MHDRFSPVGAFFERPKTMEFSHRDGEPTKRYIYCRAVPWCRRDDQHPSNKRRETSPRPTGIAVIPHSTDEPIIFRFLLVGAFFERPKTTDISHRIDKPPNQKSLGAIDQSNKMAKRNTPSVSLWLPPPLTQGRLFKFICHET